MKHKILFLSLAAASGLVACTSHPGANEVVSPDGKISFRCVSG